MPADPTAQTPPAADWSWQDDPDVVSWDVRQGPDLDKLAEVLARHGVILTEVDTGTDDVAVRVCADVDQLTQERDDALQAAAAEADLADQMRRERDDAQAEAQRAGRETTGVREELTRMAGDLEDRDLEVRRLRRELRTAREAMGDNQ